MDKRTLTMSDFATKIDKYFNVFVEYCNTFDIELFNDRFLSNPSIKYLSKSTEIKEELITYFKPLRDEILEYRYDYYTKKSIQDIANITGADNSRIISYLERIKSSFDKTEISDLSPYGDVTVETKVKHISSYKILKDFQTQERQLILQNKITERKQIK